MSEGRQSESRQGRAKEEVWPGPRDKTGVPVHVNGMRVTGCDAPPGTCRFWIDLARTSTCGPSMSPGKSGFRQFGRKVASMVRLAESRAADC